MKVIKRDCTEVEFDKSKISKAIIMAMKNGAGVKPQIAQNIADEIYNENKDKDEIAISDIEEIVFDKLIAKRQKLTAKSYEGYRKIREFQRECDNTTDSEISELLQGNSEYWNTENSNKNSRLVTTQRDYMAGIESKDITRRFLLPPNIVHAHDEGIIHFHDIDYFGQNALHNCFSGDTELVTDKGIKRFDEFYSGKVINVKDKNGYWRKAIVKKYELDVMNDVVLEKWNTRKLITCTDNHRWVLSDGTVTTKLKVGDELYYLHDTSRNFDIITKMDKYAIIIGLILSMQIKCSSFEKRKVTLSIPKRHSNFLYLFKMADAVVTNKNESDYFYVDYDLKYSVKTFFDYKVWNNFSLNEMKCFINGLLVIQEVKNSFMTYNQKIAKLVEKYAPVVGYYIANKNTYYDDINPTCYFFNLFTEQNENTSWKVKKITPHTNEFGTRILMETWCVEEPITHTFTLASGVVTGNCDLINLEDMLQNGTVINGVMIEKPKHFLTAMTIATQIITAVTSSQYGGASISLTHLAPFVRDSYSYYLKKYQDRGFDEEVSIEYAMLDLKKEIQDGVQTFNYQINSMTTTNGQSPFLSVFMYLGETKKYKAELAMIIVEFLNQRIQGMKNEVGVYVTQAFPKLLYVLEEDNIHEDSEYFYITELAAKCTAKRLVPDYISEKKMKELKEGNCFPCMGCRSFLAPWKDENGNYKFYGRYNQGVVTINLPDVALSSEGDYEKFWEILDERLNLCHEALMIRHQRLEGTLSDVAPILWQHGALARLKKGETIDKLLHGGYSSISLGFAGLYECIKYMTGDSHTDEGEGKKLALRIMNTMNYKCILWSEQDDIGYSIYGSPIENTTYKFAKCLKKRFGIVKGITDKDYVTNSYHVPVFQKIDAFSKLKFESQFQALSTGGAISYIEVGDETHNIPVIIQILQYIYNTIMYAEINTKSDYCQVCGYNGEIKIIEENGDLIWECPNCHNRDHDKMNVARRTCGYIGTNFWSKGRTEEIKERVLHIDNVDYEEE